MKDFVWDDAVAAIMTDVYFQNIWQHCMICCILMFSILFKNRKCIDENIFSSMHTVVTCYFDENKKQLYVKLIFKLYQKLLHKKNDRFIWVMNKYYKLILIIIWLLFKYCHDMIKIKNIRLAIRKTYYKMHAI